MARKRTKHTNSMQETGKQNHRTPTFLLELPLVVDEGQAKRLRAHLEAGRAFYNAMLSEGQKRLRRMRADPAWQAARAIPRVQKQERQSAFAALRQQYSFSEEVSPASRTSATTPACASCSRNQKRGIRVS